ncbi:MAG: methyltransferase domain-containing protein [Eubacteriales bacterium]
MKTYETELQTVKLEKNIKGRILDIGGGGEGVIGRLYKDKVTAIDSRQDELDEAPDGPIKMVMNAEKLDFCDENFDAVTSFFTMMYISKEKHIDVLKEAYRVMKPQGNIYIWDSCIPENKNDHQIFLLNLKIILPEEQISTGYGVEYSKQNAEYFISNLKDVGFKISKIEKSEYSFYIVAVK